MTRGNCDLFCPLDELDVSAIIVCHALILASKICKICYLFDSTSEIMYEVLNESLRRAEMNHNITYGMSKLKYMFFFVAFEIILVLSSTPC